MKFFMDNHLPIASVEVKYNGKKKGFHNLLLDTGCSSTILDTDLYEELGLLLDLENAITRKMYGIGGTEICRTLSHSDRSKNIVSRKIIICEKSIGNHYKNLLVM